MAKKIPLGLRNNNPLNIVNSQSFKWLGQTGKVEGLMVLGKLTTELRTLDFECCEDMEMEPFEGIFKVQGMRDGNLYMTEKPKRIRNKALFRDDNSSLSLGQNGRYYFVFSMSEERVLELPQQLVRQAKAIANKFLKVNG